MNPDNERQFFVIFFGQVEVQQHDPVTNPAIFHISYGLHAGRHWERVCRLFHLGLGKPFRETEGGH